MSETDDTDLLLLIPPDFFLVSSSDLDSTYSDYDLNLCLEHDEIKNSVVSDLITHVNDLESRICMIENFDRFTHSTCNEDSFINQSINSLTESDVLRSHAKENSGFLPKQNLIENPMVKSYEQSFEKSKQNQVSDLQVNISDVKTGDRDTSENSQTNVFNRPTENIPVPVSNVTENRLVVAEHNEPEVQVLKGNQKGLLFEVDYFLENKKKHIGLESLTQSESLDKELVLISQDIPYNVQPLTPDAICRPTTENNFLIDTTDHNFEQSLGLPEVYQLLREMEETQYEIEKKFKLHESHAQETIDTSVKNKSIGNSNNIQGSQLNRPVEDLYYVNRTKPIFNNTAQIVFERLKNIQENNYQTTDNFRQVNNTNTEVRPLFTQTPSVLHEEGSYHKDSKLKSISPNRTSVSCNPIDIVKANLPRKDDRPAILQSGEEKDLPKKIAGFRRHLNFDRLNLPLKAPKSRPLHMEQNTNYQIETEQKNENDRVNVDFSHGTNRKNVGSHTLEEKFNSLAVQRTTSDKLYQNAAHNLENKPSSIETLQQKISSTNLLSLSDLWNKEPTFYSDDPSKLRQKLEEEKYRRQHCEQQIQVLQLRVLEEQEKLAVAIKVDQEKDKVILQITDSWRKLNDHWNELEEQRHSLAQQLQDEKESSKNKNVELNKKVERWEKEVSQALDLAAGYKEKSEAVQKEMELLRKYTDDKLIELNTQLCNTSEENKKITNNNNNLSKQLKAAEERIEQEEELLSQLKVELEKLKNQLSEYEAEVSVLKEQKETLLSKIKDEKNRSAILERQKSTLQQSLNEATKREKATQEEARASSERIEVQRTELKALYQGQLDSVVKEKLQEFQNQLEAAQVALKAELHLKEKQWAEKAHEQFRQLQERHKKELDHLDASYREEINKWKGRLMESEKLKSVTESRLQEETNRRALIAQRLHNVMETQWQEALNIISNPMNLYEMPKDDNRGRWPSNHQSLGRLKGNGDSNPSRSNSTGSLAQAEEAPFCREGLVTSRTTTQPPQDLELKKYIQMLLDRGPGNPIPQHDTFQESLDQAFSPEDSLLAHRWMQDNAKKSNGQMQRLGQSGKPPWK